MGKLPGKYSLALPSGAPLYFFDGNGRYSGWGNDPGDFTLEPNWKPISEVNVVDFEEAKT